MTNKASVNEDFALFDAIFNQVEEKAEDDELFFKVSPVVRNVNYENQLSGETTHVSTSDEDKKAKKLSIVNEVDEIVEADAKRHLKKINENVPSDLDDIEETGENKPIEKARVEVNKMSSSDSDKDLEEYSEKQNSDSHSGNNSDSSSNNNYSPKKQHVKFSERKRSKKKATNTLSLSIDYDEFQKLLSQHGKKSGDKITIGIERVADVNNIISSHRSQHKYSSRPQIYKESNFPLLLGMVNDDGDEILPKEKAIRKKKKKRRKRNKKKQQQKNSEEGANPGAKAKLDSRLNTSNNPALLEWLHTKNVAEKEKRRQKRKEEMIRRNTEKLGKKGYEQDDDERIKKLEEWIERKKKEKRDKKKNHISTQLETDKRRPVNHNQLNRPKTAVPKRSPAAPAPILKPATESTDTVVSSKNRPKSSPTKSFREKGYAHPSFNDFRNEYLNDKETPSGYTSVKMFVEAVVQGAIVELERQNKVKQARLHHRPNTSVVRQKGVVWRDTESVTNDLKQRPFSSVTRLPTAQHAIKPSIKKPARPSTSLPRKTNKYEFDRDKKFENTNSYEVWLAQKKEQALKNKKLRQNKAHYDQLEEKTAIEEIERRRKEVQESKKRVKTGLRREKEPSDNVYNYYQPTMVRPEPQGRESHTTDDNGSLSSLPDIIDKPAIITNKNPIKEDKKDDTFIEDKIDDIAVLGVG